MEGPPEKVALAWRNQATKNARLLHAVRLIDLSRALFLVAIHLRGRLEKGCEFICFIGRVTHYVTLLLNQIYL